MYLSFVSFYYNFSALLKNIWCKNQKARPFSVTSSLLTVDAFKDLGFWFLNQASVDGGAKRDRTADLLRAKQALSQLSYSPMTLFNGFAVKYFGGSSLPNMVGLGRLELPTSPLSGVRSNQLSYRPILTGPVS